MPDGPSAPASKPEWRRVVAARRRARGEAERLAAARAVAERVLALPAVIAAGTVAAYASFPSEPGTGPLREALRTRGTRVLLPVVLDDRDLDWVPDTADPDPATVGEPAGQPLGVEAVAAADVVVCPAVAVDRSGTRLGRGGGSYDRALARVPARIPVVALLFDDEVVDTVVGLPRAPHDRPVSMVITPSRTLTLPQPSGSASNQAR